jgi:hypothetical protein
MYWRFRYLTRNRLRLQSWWNRRRNPRPAYGFRPRGAAAMVYRRSGRRSWTALLALVVLLTALSVSTQYVTYNGALYFALRMAIYIGCLYYALRGV